MNYLKPSSLNSRETHDTTGGGEQQDLNDLSQMQVLITRTPEIRVSVLGPYASTTLVCGGEGRLRPWILHRRVYGLCGVMWHRYCAYLNSCKGLTLIYYSAKIPKGKRYLGSCRIFGIHHTVSAFGAVGKGCVGEDGPGTSSEVPE